ncbi:response regulator [Brevibacillus ruminantium]|uniref:histidine kinase n=1 Tax=Brevibacillus ruminantium TaxID=2950604 RepID=A0ABY4WKI3_9BACL|nr:response regulator [Brevibacillus ruminantium]USG66653.1 response regulator [Brevibacillus ruminantium]
MQMATKKLTEQKNFIVNCNDYLVCSPITPSEDAWEAENKVHILLVDDRKENLLSLEAVLDSPEYHLVSVQSGEEALRCMLNDEFACVLLDVQMPGMNGFETAKLIKQREKSRHIPILFITAISKATEHVVQGYEAGAIDYIFKPFHPDTLRMKVEGFIQLYRKQKQIEYQREMLRYRTMELLEANKSHYYTLMELQKSEALSRTIVEASADTILTLDENRIILSANQVVESMFGYQICEIIGMHIELLLEIPSKNSRCREDRIIETVATRSDHTQFAVDVQFKKATVQQKHIYVCSIRDITERKQLEIERKHHYQQLEQLVNERTQELVLSQELFQKIFQSSPCLMAIRSCKDRCYIDVNKSWLSYTGYAYEEVKHLPHDRLILAKESVQAECAIDLEDAVRNEKISYVTRSGEVREGLLSTEKINIRGECCILSVITDITDRVYLEKEMARLDRLHLIGEMAAGIAHEIRNPMTTVRGFLQLEKSKKDTESFQFVDIMITELDRANTIITEFLTLAKNRTSNLKKQHLLPIIEPLLPLVQAEASLSGKDLYTELKACPELFLDVKEIRQLFLNLTLNGMEAMNSGGVLTVKTYVKDQDVVLEIGDQGPGIDEDLLDKIWTPFFTTKEEGTGLGLAVCYSIANRHHARIEVETSERGTTFFVLFPIRS